MPSPSRPLRSHDPARVYQQRAWAEVGISSATAARLRHEHARLRADTGSAPLQRAEDVLDVDERRRLMAAIAAAYGRTFQRASDTLLWLGFAALAVNDGVAPTADLARAAARILRTLAGTRRAGPLRRASGLAEDGIKAALQANFAIFDDLFWVHLAYLEGGLARLHTLGRALDPELLTAFATIDQGRLHPDRCAGERLISEGNRMLFEREQRAAVTPVFTTFASALQTATRLGLITLPNQALRASCEALGRSPAWPSPRWPVMGRPPSYGPLAARWAWLQACGWPAYLHLCRERPAVLERELRRAIAGEPQGARGTLLRLAAAFSDSSARALRWASSA